MLGLQIPQPMRVIATRHALLPTFALAIAAMAGTLAPAAASPVSAAQAAVIRDDTGAVLRLKTPARRIVSLAPGATEMLFAAGAGDRVLATVTGADEPAAAKKIPRIGDANALVFDRLIALEPDAVVVWKDLTNELVIDSLVNKLKLNVYYVSVRSLDDIPQSVRRLGVLAGTQPVAAKAAAAMEAKIARLPKKMPPDRGKPFDVFFMIHDSPLYTVGSRNVVSDAIARCGGRNIYDHIDFPAPIAEFEDIKKRNPDVILMSAPPITARDWRERWARFPGIKAVQNRQVLGYADLRLTRMGPGAIDAVPPLCSLLEQAVGKVRP
jgi:iron complex transport system substrate-binding protein